MKRPFIALITDFGEDDFFVASLKGVILRINPGARIIDVTHQVPSFDIKQGSFILFSCYNYFPARTIFLVVVDPGVGSSRSILLVKTEKYFFIAPDNGVLSLVLKSEEVQQVIKVTNTKFFLEKPSKTFEGRDKMAPVAAWLSKGTTPSLFGPEIQDYEVLGKLEPIRKEGEITGSILHADKFGNLITNIPKSMLNKLRKEAGKKRKAELILLAKNKKISTFRENYSQGRRGELFYLIGSLNFVEIAARETSASSKLKAQVGDKVRIVMVKPKKKVIAKDK
ncbi:MAG: hypothetical protein GTO17_03145 [Candidatus Aminicenantes bacterium]|nr:hypothetical protein [Candidatus Aminicenantes bacterium]